MSGGTKIGYEVGKLKSKNGLCVSFLNRLIQDHLDHNASKELKNPRPKWILRFL